MRVGAAQLHCSIMTLRYRGRQLVSEEARHSNTSSSCAQCALQTAAAAADDDDGDTQHHPAAAARSETFLGLREPGMRCYLSITQL